MNWLIAILAAWTVVKVSDGDTIWATRTATPSDARLMSSLATNRLDCATNADVHDEHGSAISQPELPSSPPSKDDQRIVKVRLQGIDAPESDQKRGKEARDFLAGMVLGKEVELEGAGKDRYGRMVAKVKCEGKDVNLEMVKAGMAWRYVEYDREGAYEAAEEEARREKRGVWQDADPVKPGEWRRRKRK